jgi:hypothetical protein
MNQEPPGGPGGPTDPPPTDPPPTDPPPNPFASVGETWREDLVGASGFEGDDAESFTNVLSRVGDFKTLLGNYKSMQDKIRSGEMAQPLPENPTDEQLAAYREAHGIPEAADQYDLQLADGVELTDEDKEIFNSVFETALAENVPNASLSAVTNTFLEARNKIVERQQQQDNVDKQEADKFLKENWGADFKRNTNMVDAFISKLPADVQELFRGARLANGVGLLNSPEVMIHFANAQMEIDPAGVVVPNTDNPIGTINDQIAAYEAKMGTDEWYKDAKAQKHYQELVDARERLQSR